MKVATWDAGDTAYFLRMALGRIRTNWSDFLADCIRGRTDLAGHQLTPITRVRVRGDRRKRPRYALTEVNDFVRAVLTEMPRPTEAERAFKKFIIEIDTTELVMRRAASILETRKCK
jgi:hypothetical protein